MAFPNTSILSLFDDPPENPLSEGGRWIQTSGQRPPMRKTGGAATDSLHGDPNYSSWVAEAFTGDAEVWGCTAGGQLGAALETWRVMMFKDAPSSVKGYLAFFGGGIGKGFTIRRYDGPSFADFVPIAGIGFAGYPERIGLRINGSLIEGWAMYGGVWSLQTSVADTTYRGTWYIGIGVEDPSGGGLTFPCFGGGVPHRTQFFRWLHN